jgi:hypothetical protein
MQIATAVVNRVLRENFGFKHLLWVRKERKKKEQYSIEPIPILLG